MPRINRWQTQQNNAQASTAEQYYRITLYNEFLSHVIAELEERFVKSPPQYIGLLHLLPWECSSTATDTTDTTDNMPEDFAKTVEFYEEDLPHPVMLPTEYRLWSAKWLQHKEELQKKLVDVFLSCDRMTFPNIKVLLHLALTVPITSSESKRSFSQLKLLKTAYRLTTSSICLGGLTLMKMNHEECNKIKQTPSKMVKLVTLFHQMHPRCMKLTCILSEW